MYDSANCVPDKTGSRWRYGYPSACRMSPPSFQEQLQFVRKKLLGKW